MGFSCGFKGDIYYCVALIPRAGKAGRPHGLDLALRWIRLEEALYIELMTARG